MKKNSRIALLILFLMCLLGSASAQYTFVVDALTKDSTILYPYDASAEKEWVHLGDPVGYLKNGTEVTIAAADTVSHTAYFRSKKKSMFYKKTEYEGSVYTVNHNGTRYFVDAKDLMLSPNDTTGVRDFVNKSSNYHNFWGRFYSSYTPYIAIFVLLLLATIFAKLINGAGGPRLLPTILVPLFVLLAVLLEVFGVIKMGTDMLWWIDDHVIDKGKVIIRLIFFALAVIMQVFSMKLYKNGIVAYAVTPDEKVLVKRPMVGALIGVGLLIASVVVAMIWKKSAGTILGVGAALLVAATLVGIISTAVVNMRVLGKLAGLAFTLFVVIYAVGLISCIVLLIIGLVKVFMEMLITVFGGTIVLMVMSKVVPTRTYTSGGVTYEVYEDFNPFKRNK
jgi:hypothetical protein